MSNVISEKRKLANTGVNLSPLALGTVKFGRNQSVKYPGTFDLPDDSSMQSILALSLESGINTLDTAPAYGIAEERLGKNLQNRQQWKIITKAGEIYDPAKDISRYDYSTRSLEKQLDNSLRLLKTDYIDCWLLHSNGEDVQNLNDDVLSVFEKAKKSGKVLAIGASTKTIEGGSYALEHMDCIMMASSLNHTEENTLFEKAETIGKSILLKKIFDSGWALESSNKQKIMRDTFQTLFAYPATCSAIIGTINPKHLIENIASYIDSQESAHE